MDPAAGDQACNVGRPASLIAASASSTRPSADARFYQSSTALTLAPGEFGSIVVAYIFAAPVAIPGFAPRRPPTCTPGNPVPPHRTSPTCRTGANRIDSLTGFRGFSDVERQRAGRPERVPHRPGLAAQQGADGAGDLRQRVPPPVRAGRSELLPHPGRQPGHGRLAAKSTSEIRGDPYFEVANDPGDAGSTEPAVRPELPSVRRRGLPHLPWPRGQRLGQLTLVAQFDYAGTTIERLHGPGEPDPELRLGAGRRRRLRGGVRLRPVPPAWHAGDRRAQHSAGGRHHPGAARAVRVPCSPTATADRAQRPTRRSPAPRQWRPYPPLADTGVPFAYVDRESKNNFRYFYSVTAFDVNSFQSGPSSLESALTTKAVTPSADGEQRQLRLAPGDHGRTRMATRCPRPASFTVDAATGKFSGRPPAVTAVQIQGVFAPALPGAAAEPAAGIAPRHHRLGEDACERRAVPGRGQSRRSTARP